MLSWERTQAVLDRIEYGPGWRFRALGDHVHITTAGPRPLRILLGMPEFTDEAALVAWLEKRLEMIV